MIKVDVKLRNRNHYHFHNDDRLYNLKVILAIKTQQGILVMSHVV